MSDQPLKKGQLAIYFDVDTGNPDIIALGYDAEGDETSKQKKTKKPPNDPKFQKVKDIIPCAIYTHKGSNCITFVIGGFEYEYCF